MSPADAKAKHKDELTAFEAQEIVSFDTIYTIGTHRVSRSADFSKSDGVYPVTVGEQLAYRYEVDKVCGEGAFGQVLMCRDMKHIGKMVAIKIGKSSKSDIDNAQIESKFLMRIGSKDPDKHRMIRILDSFFFRRHFLIVTEVLDMNLYEYIKGQQYRGMERGQLRRVATQVLQGLKHLADIKIIHCDLKPENILFTDAHHRDIKIIDFGSACTEFKNGFTYV